jgi:hypothetical protein
MQFKMGSIVPILAIRFLRPSSTIRLLFATRLPFTISLPSTRAVMMNKIREQAVSVLFGGLGPAILVYWGNQAVTKNSEEKIRSEMQYLKSELKSDINNLTNEMKTRLDNADAISLKCSKDCAALKKQFLDPTTVRLLLYIFSLILANFEKLYRRF